MEDPKDRDRKEMWSYSLRPYGFRTFEHHNAQLVWDAQISQVPGRRDPFDDLLQQERLPPK